MRRFFFSRQQEEEGLVVLSPEESRHISRVLRLEPGEVVELLDGRGSVFGGEIVAVGAEVQVRITAERPTVVGQTDGTCCSGRFEGAEDGFGHSKVH
ncbi:RNA methyltransferase PUA domain-containing protein [Desulfotalea psychrophila]|uniref:Ribosomal RNA small subunit methyltransferase E PUA-like domain-containing protein n=1 Tax=Desulfotalea psychrophila (strain LSv54 / DSM 12343) TaxID=177439 RepID=Q6AQE9_DESPS|nr:RNA methyltransferase PUA domain-containing protein [Desulfotalea psychrophila]CAG35424.1 hypothetical protein DP0695 [Desulfotalea psychrophila LSv54]